MSAPVVFSRSLPPFLRQIGFCISAAAILSTTSWAAESGGIRVGFARLPAQLADHGELLLGELNCLACHGADPTIKARLASKQAPVLGQGGLTPQFLRKLLSDPQGAKPGTTMPDLLHDLPAPERTAAVDALVHFLVSTSTATNSAPMASDEAKIQQGRLLYHQVGCIACHAPQEPVSALQSKGSPGETSKKDSELLDPESIPLGDLARKTTVDALARLLKDPLKIRPSGRMPSLNLTDAEANAISM